MNRPSKESFFLPLSYPHKSQQSEGQHLQPRSANKDNFSSTAQKDSTRKSIFSGLKDLPPKPSITPTTQQENKDPKSVSRSLTPNYIGKSLTESHAISQRQSTVQNLQSSMGIQQQKSIFSKNPEPKPNSIFGVRKTLSNKSFAGHEGDFANRLGEKKTVIHSQTLIRDSTQPRPLSQDQRTSNRPSTVVKMDPRITSSVQKLPYFTDKRVVVTGASSGIGRAVAMWFLNSGAKVALIGRDLDSLINIGKQFPTQALVIKCDLSQDDQPYDMFNTVMSEFNGIDILINGAGVFKEGDTKTTLPQDYDYIMDVNLRSVFYLSYLFFPALQKSRGCVINLCCQYGTKPYAGLFAYCMSKAGVAALTRAMAYEFAVCGVRVNAVAPGLVDTNLLVYRNLPETEIEKIYENAENYTPLKRIASVEDVGKAIIFLCSEAASHVTGQVINVDGGRNLTSSGWHLWEGAESTNLILESKESIIASLKGKILGAPNAVLSKKESEKIEGLLKQTNWSSSNKDAHSTIKQARYKEQDIRNNPKVSVKAMENTFQKIYN